tara:strand:- start:205 stop:627 length:423 start_codon:yes stop_codon:yes gene_type:complete
MQLSALTIILIGNLLTCGYEKNQYLTTCIAFVSCEKEELKKPDFFHEYWNQVNSQPEKKRTKFGILISQKLATLMKGRGTTFIEILPIVEINDSLFFKVESVNEKHTLFKSTEHSETSFTYENPENEFPKKSDIHSKTTN